MLARWTIFGFLFFYCSQLFAQIDRAKFQRMAPEERFALINDYLTKNWREFHDTFGLPAPQSDRLLEYRFMRSIAKDPKNSCLLRVFWCRNQQHVDLYYRGLPMQEFIDTLSSIRGYAHQQHLQAEEGCCWLVWCKAIVEHGGAMSVRQRQRLAYDGAIRGISLLESLPLSAVPQYKRGIYDITHHIWWMSMYFFRIEEYELARRMAALGNRFAHPKLETTEGHADRYRFYEWEFLNLLGSCHLRLGDLKQARDWYQKAYVFARSQDDQLRQDISYTNVGIVLQQQGKVTDAESYLKRAMAQVQAANAQQPSLALFSEDYFQSKWYDKARLFDRERFQLLSPDERFAVMDDYFTKQWRRFYNASQNAAQKASLLADYQFMRIQAKDPKSLTFLRLFWVRNQQYLHVNEGEGYNNALDSLVAIREYTHQNNLRAEEGICWLAWCKLILQHPNKMDHRTRRRLVYEGAVKGLNLLEKLPLSVSYQYNGATYDLTYHLWWMSMYFYQIEEYELLRRVATLGYRCVHPSLVNKSEDPLGLEETRGYIFYKWHFLNDLGSYYLQMGRWTQAESLYRQAYAFAKSNKSSVEEGVSYGNIGVVLSKQGKWAAAVPYLEQALRAAHQQDNNRVSIFKAIVPLSEVYLQLKQYDKAFPTLQRAVSLYNPVDMLVPEVDSLALIPLMAGLGEVYQQRGNLKQALYYTRLSNHLETKRRQNDDARTFRQKKEKLEAEAYRARLDQIDADRTWALWLRNAAIVCLVLVSVLSLLYLGNQRQQRREAEQQLALLAKQARANTAQLAEIQQRQNNATVVISDDSVSLQNALMQSAILTDADWERFRKLFERAYPSYLMRLRSAFSTLTPAEIRVICLSRISLSTKEMANILGVSSDTIVKTRYRIRKKTNLPEGTDLVETFKKV